MGSAGLLPGVDAVIVPPQAEQKLDASAFAAPH
jgi:hypothetical protein